MLFQSLSLHCMLAMATTALFVLSATAKASTTKYDHGSSNSYTHKLANLANHVSREGEGGGLPKY